DPLMVRELGKLRNVSIEVIDAGEANDPEGQKRIAALADIHARESVADQGEHPVALTFRFGLRPPRVDRDRRVTGLRVAGPGGEETITASSSLTAIGFQSDGDLDRHSLVEAAGRSEAGRLGDRLYSAGWFGRGPRGTIPDSRAEAQAVAALI